MARTAFSVVGRRRVGRNKSSWRLLRTCPKTPPCGRDSPACTGVSNVERGPRSGHSIGPHAPIFAPSDPVCCTEVPSDLRSFVRQRARWQKGLLDVLWPNRDMLLGARYGRIGWIALPYLWIFELLAPVLELGGMVTIILAAPMGVLSRQFFLQFLLFRTCSPL
jgi:hypothetical protein